MILSLVNVTLHTLDDSVLPSTNWVLELLGECKHLEEAAGITITQAVITTFQEEVAKPFITHLKENISSRFASLSKIPGRLQRQTHLTFLGMAKKQ